MWAVEAPGMYIVSAAKGAARGASKIWEDTRRGRRKFGFFGFFVFSLNFHGMSAFQFSERLFTEMAFVRPWWHTIV